MFPLCSTKHYNFGNWIYFFHSFISINVLRCQKLFYYVQRMIMWLRETWIQKFQILHQYQNSNFQWFSNRLPLFYQHLLKVDIQLSLHLQHKILRIFIHCIIYFLQFFPYAWNVSICFFYTCIFIISYYKSSFSGALLYFGLSYLVLCLTHEVTSRSHDDFQISDFFKF